MLRRFLLSSLATIALNTSAHAQQAPAPQELSTAQLQQLEAAMAQNPRQFDLYFTYAQIATDLGEHQKAADAYLHMLSVDPGLDRVRLDLAMSYARLGHYQQAETLLRQVLKRQIPDQVRHTIENVLKDLEKSAKPSVWSGFVSTGVNWDSNANSASSTGRVSILDTSIPLGSADRRQGDFQVFGSAGVTNRTRLTDPARKDFGASWDSSVTAYQSKQYDLSQFNLKVLSLQTGPTVTVPSLATQFGLDGNFTYIALAGDSYLRQYAAEFTTATTFSPRWRVQSAWSLELHNYLNNANASTYEDRNGPAQQVKLISTYSVTPKDIVDAELLGRVEKTRQEYYDNTQGGIAAGFTHLFRPDVFLRTQVGFKRYVYDSSDLLISHRRRADDEATTNLSMTKIFMESFALTGSYQYRNVDSTIENYNYDNHRIGASVSWQF